MARFSGLIGYVHENVQTSPGVWEDSIVELKRSGDIVRTSRRLENDAKVNDDITVNNSVSILADAYAREHFFAIRYVKWSGVLWTVVTATVEHPRLILELGGVYVGPTA